MLRLRRNATFAVAVLAAASASGREVCQERALSLRYSPQSGSSWCWAASGQMVMELLGVEEKEACQCRQAEQVLGVAGCCATSSSCVPAGDVAARCDEARWPAFVERPDRYGLAYRTTCDGLPNRQDDEACDASPLGWMALSAELCAGRPVLAAFRSPGATRGHMVVVKGFSIHGGRRVLVVDPKRLCPEGRACEGELDEGFWIPYEEYAAGWSGFVHWVDFYGIRRKPAGRVRPSRHKRGRRRREQGMARTRLLRGVAVGAKLVCLNACGGGGDGPATPPVTTPATPAATIAGITFH